MRDNFYRLKTVYIRVTKVETYLVGNEEVVKYNTRYAVTKLSERSL